MLDLILEGLGLGFDESGKDRSGARGAVAISGRATAW